MELQRYDGKRIALKLKIGDSTRVFSSVARYEHDENLGDIIRLVLEDDADELGNIHIVIQEDQWDVPFMLDSQHGCDFAVQLQDME